MADGTAGVDPVAWGTLGAKDESGTREFRVSLTADATPGRVVGHLLKQAYAVYGGGKWIERIATQAFFDMTQDVTQSDPYEFSKLLRRMADGIDRDGNGYSNLRDMISR